MLRWQNADNLCLVHNLMRLRLRLRLRLRFREWNVGSDPLFSLKAKPLALQRPLEANKDREASNGQPALFRDALKVAVWTAMRHVIGMLREHVE
tara:strand:+ start:394 stop:675 length:282 start_codon:yes stop_codon:yes gene_type:complete